jgi:MATE family multidrug resistance protein
MSHENNKNYKNLIEDENDFLSKTLITINNDENNKSNLTIIENQNSATFLDRNEPQIKILNSGENKIEKENEEKEYNYDNLSTKESINGIFDIEKIKEICILALPISLFFSCLFLQQTINLIFVGNLINDSSEKKDALNAIGITHIYINCGCISIIAGLISGFETLGSNAYGAKNFRLFGLYFQRSQLISYILVTIFLLIHYFFALNLLGSFGVKENVLIYISRYLPICLLFCFLDVQFSLNFRYLNIIDKSHYNLLFLLITLLLHPLWCYIFMVVFDFGVEGAALSLVISQLINVIFGSYYIYIIKPLPESIFMFYKQSFRGWWNYLKISIPSAFLMCAEWWAWEILAVIAATLSQDDFTVHIFTINIMMNIAVILIGFAMAITILVGREFGKGKIKTAIQYFKICAFISNILIFIVSILIFFFKKQIFNNFMHENSLLERSEKVLQLLSVIIIFDLNQALFTAFFKGIGKLMYASAITFSNFYIFQVGFALIFTEYLKLEIFGIWMAICIAAITSCLINSIVYCKMDLKEVLQQTQRRLSADNKQAYEE